MKVAEIANQMTLGKATVEKLDDIGDDHNIFDAVAKLTKPTMTAVLVMYIKNFMFQTSRETLVLIFIVMLNASGFHKKGAVV